MFAILEQQRVSRDAVENLGRPDFARHQQKMRQIAIQETQKRHLANEEQRKKAALANPPQTGTKPQ